MNGERKIKLYSLSTCSHCRAIKKLLEDDARMFEFVDVDLLQGKERRVILEEVRQLNRRCSFPTMLIGDTIIVGYRLNDIREALGI
ncbi:MAG: glutaredoxin [Desulfobulbaceae bacterium BRH_c16a]|nr:MAG: glutaredoxin [Desulfobulbaceae bacterium BRH_c16a]